MSESVVRHFESTGEEARKRGPKKKPDQPNTQVKGKHHIEKTTRALKTLLEQKKLKKKKKKKDKKPLKALSPLISSQKKKPPTKKHCKKKSAGKKSA